MFLEKENEAEAVSRVPGIIRIWIFLRSQLLFLSVQKKTEAQILHFCRYVWMVCKFSEVLILRSR